MNLRRLFIRPPASLLILCLATGFAGGCGLTLEPSASASLSGDRTTSVRISRTAPRAAPSQTPEAPSDDSPSDGTPAIR
ncbi:MAG: hypothetical protein AAGG09_12670 [Pseudomonadota bacterium]